MARALGGAGLSDELTDMALPGRSPSVLTDASPDDSAERERFARRFISVDMPMLSAMPTDSPMRTLRTTASHVSLTAHAPAPARLRLSGLRSNTLGGSLLAWRIAGDMRSAVAPAALDALPNTCSRVTHLGAGQIERQSHKCQHRKRASKIIAC